MDPKELEQLKKRRAERRANRSIPLPKNEEYTAGELKLSANPEIVFGVELLPDHNKVWANPEQVGFMPGKSKAAKGAKDE